MMFNEPFGTLFAEDVPYYEIKPEYKKEYWEIGFGLQKIDGLEPSQYLVKLAEKQVAGEITHQELMQYLTEYHAKDSKLGESEEADFTSARIAELLSENSFHLSPPMLLHYHQKIFTGIKSFIYPVGAFRTINMGKKESVLGGTSVEYAPAAIISSTLNFAFEREQEHSYKGLTKEQMAHRIMKFISTVWHVHPFREGNTRTVSTFAIKYLRSFGFDIDNEPFKNHAKFLRDALVLDNAPSPEQKTDQYLRMFTENAVLGGKNELVIKG